MSIEKVELRCHSCSWSKIKTKKVWQATVRVETIEEFVPGRIMRTIKMMGGTLLSFSWLLIAAGCSSGGFTIKSGGGGNGPSAENVYITQDIILDPQLSQNIMQFSASATGNVTPSTVLKGPASVSLNGLAVDATGNLFVGGTISGNGPNASAEVLIYAPGAMGAATPSRTIAGASTGLSVPGLSGIDALALDSSGNLYVSSFVNIGGILYPSVSVFSNTANGNVAPTNIIGGNATTINGFFPGQIAVDSANNVYTAGGSLPQADSILIFNSKSNGNVPPTGMIAGSNTMLEDVVGIAVDSEGNIYATNGNANGATPSIVVFSSGSTGNATPVRTITGAATTMIAPGNLTVDSAGNIYVLDISNVLKFSPSAMGNVAPSALISFVGFSGVSSIVAQ
jgi:hypothetical protein